MFLITNMISFYTECQEDSQGKTTSNKTSQEKFKLENKYLGKLKNVITECNHAAVIILISYPEDVWHGPP